MLILDLLKILISKEARETAGGILKLIRSSPEWKKDLNILEGQFSTRERERILVLINYAAQLLASKKWDDENIQVTRFIVSELARNAFEHGLKQDSKKKISIKVEVSSDFFKTAVTDPGAGFNLESELERQGAKDRDSNTCRALGFIYRMVANLSQNISNHEHTIFATLEKDYSPCKVERSGNITIFGFERRTPSDGYFWAEIVREIQELPQDSRVILDFTNVNDIGTRVLSQIMSLLMKYDLREIKRLSKPNKLNPEDFLVTLNVNCGKSSNVVVCGHQKVNYVLRDFLTTRFRVFENRKAALEYFSAPHTHE